MQEIYDHAPDNVIVARSPINCAIFNQAWAVVWAINNHVTPEYVGFIDDDVEFTEDIIQGIKDCEPFSLCALGNSATLYKKGITINPPWLDGCGLFVKFEDCIKYGVRDSQQEAPWVFYSSVEYLHRLRWFTGRPAVSNGEKIFYLHHQREDKDLIDIRDETAEKAFYYASRFWKDKFGIDLPIDPIGDPHLWDKLYDLCTARNKQFKKHLIFDGMWTDWEGIYNRYGVEVIHG